MDPPDPHGGGVVHASTPKNGNVAFQLTEALGVPDTPTPSQWHPPGLFGAAMERYNEEETQQALDKTPDVSAGLEGRGLGALSKNRGITKPLRRAPPRPLVVREPLRDISRQFQSLTGDIEKVIEQQALTQQQARQGDYETLWGQFNEMVHGLRADLQLRDEHYQGRITTLEQEVSRLNIELITANKPPPRPTQPAQMPMSPASPAPVHRPPKQTANNTQTPMSIALPALAHRPHRRAANNTEASTEAPITKIQPGKKDHSYADVVALMATKPGGQAWQEVLPKQKSRAAKAGPQEAPRGPKDLKPAKEKNREARRLLFRRVGGPIAPRADREEIILALNRVLARKGLPIFVRVVDAGYTETGAISVLLEKGALGTMVIPYYRDALMAAICPADPAVVSVELPEQWYRVKVHGVPLRRYLTFGLGLAREEIELGTNYRLKRDPTWLRDPRELREGGKKGSTIVVTVGSLEEARTMLINGLRFGGHRFQTEHFWQLGADCVCPRCCGIGHTSYRACGNRPPCCYICAGNHEGTEHACKVITCQAKAGTACIHLPAKCGNCGGDHLATARLCPMIRQARRRLSKRTGEDSDIGHQHQQIQALIPSSPGFAVVVASQPAQQAPKQVSKQARRDPEAPEQETTGQEPKEASLQTPRQQTPTTPVVDWSAIQQVDLVNRLDQSVASQPRDGEMDTGWDPATITQNEPDSEDEL